MDNRKRNEKIKGNRDIDGIVKICDGNIILVLNRVWVRRG